MKVDLFNAAKTNKNDEYYTLYEDIEKDLEWYSPHFKDKIIYCPCDDHRSSEFVRYFKNNFHRFGIKALLASGYDLGNGAYAYKYDGKVEIALQLPKGDSIYGSECDAMWNAADIIITNPPFSKTRDFFDRLMERGKDFIIYCTIAAAYYKNIFPYIKDDRVRADCKWKRYFLTPAGEKKEISNIILLTTFTPPPQ